MAEIAVRCTEQPAERRKALEEYLMANIAEQLRRAIEKSGESYYALAQRTGVDAGVIMRFAKGERDLRLETAAKLAKELGLDLRSRK